jgi:hypothetical protein
MLLPGNDDGYEILKIPDNYQPQQKTGQAPSQQYRMPDAEQSFSNQNL